MSGPDTSLSPHHPKVERVQQTLAAPVAAADVPRLLADLLGDAARAESVVTHGGLWVDGRGWSQTDLPAGAALAVYAFTREPVPVPLPEPLVLWDDGELVAVNKPAWLPIQGTRASRRFSLEALLATRLGAPGLTAVHRLDRETSGLVLFARTGEGAAEIHRQFRTHRIRKTYLAVVAPPPARPAFTVRGHMERREHPAHSFFGLAAEAPATRTAADAAFSETHFVVLPDATGPDATGPDATGPDANANANHPDELATALLAVRPVTGRTHQIRVHLRHVGCPIVGDTLYGGVCLTGPSSGDAPSARLQLHAAALVFATRRGPQALVAPVPDDFLRRPAAFSAARADALFPDAPA